METLLDGLGTEKFLSRDEEEVAGYAAAMNFVFDADGRELGIIFQTTSPFDTPREIETLTMVTALLLTAGG